MTQTAVPEQEETAIQDDPSTGNKSESLEINSKKSPHNNFYYLIQVDGDPEFKLNANSARKNGVKAEFLPVGWVYKNKKDAEDVSKRWTQGKRKLRVVPWYDSRLDTIWFGNKDKASIAKKSIRLEIDRCRLNKAKEKIALDCGLSGLHSSWLYVVKITENDPFVDH